MVHYNRITTKFLQLLLLVLVCMKYDFQLVSGEIRCLAKERDALLMFKKGFADQNNVLSSWGSADDKKECCRWWGVRCSNTTSHVTGLLLGSAWFGGNYISSALLELQHLNDLDLSGNNFGGQIPNFIGSMKQLQHLYLNWSDFSGIIPPQLGNLTNLRTLDLSGNSGLRSYNLDWLSHLSFLTRLDLSGSNISDSYWLHQLLKLPSLKELSLRDCNITSSTFDWLFNISRSLVKLDLGHNQLHGSIPDALENFIYLEYLDLSENVFAGRIPKSLGKLSHLQTLDLSHNELEGTISEAHFMQLHNLNYLDLSFNSLTLDLSPDWVPPFQLERIGLANCKMGSSFPKWLLTQRKFWFLDISNANITDEVPKSFWNLCDSVGYLNLSNNQMNGTISAISSIFRGQIDVSSNKFSGPVPLLHPNISLFQLSQNMFSGPLSPSICSNSNDLLISLLDLSSNQLEGELPKCWENLDGLVILNLNNNNFFGEIPHAFGSLMSLESLHLGGNNLSGELPSALMNCRSLQMIDIGGNKLTGNIPSWLGGNYPSMTWLSLRNNRFYGNIPPEICYLTQIQLLDLSKNNISGKIPKCFNNFTLLVDKNISFTDMTYLIDGVGTGDYLEYALVQWKGRESEYKNIKLGLLKLIDLSSNRLVGNIPRAFSNLSGLVSLNLSRNYLTGCIDQNIGQMEMLDVLDLSRNQLSGEIPIGLAHLYFLAVLDLSNNNLLGKIPLSTQLQSFDPSAYAGNSKLCGHPLPLCPGDRPVSPISNQEEDKNTHDDRYVWFLRTSFFEGPWISVILGFIVGFWGIVGSLVLKKSWRAAYYIFWDDIGDCCM